jgi:hypothetical protein
VQSDAPMARQVVNHRYQYPLRRPCVKFVPFLPGAIDLAEIRDGRPARHQLSGYVPQGESVGNRAVVYEIAPLAPRADAYKPANWPARCWLRELEQPHSSTPTARHYASSE